MFDEITADRSVGVAEQDLARIRAAQLLLESTSYPDIKAAPRSLRRTGSDLSPFRARIAGPVSLAHQLGYLRGAAMAGYHCPMTARRRRACARAPKHCRPCFRRSQRADGGKRVEWENDHAPPATSDRSCRSRRTFRRAGRLWRWRPRQFRSLRFARLPRHQEEAAGRAQAGIPRWRAGPRAGRAEGSLQGRRVSSRSTSRTRRPRPPRLRRRRSRSRSAPRNRKGKQAASTGRRDLPQPPMPRRDGGRRSTAAAPPAPKPQKIARKRTTAPPPDQPAQQPGAVRHRPAIRRAIPGADAERHVHALISFFSFD